MYNYLLVSLVFPVLAGWRSQAWADPRSPFFGHVGIFPHPASVFIGHKILSRVQKGPKIADWAVDHPDKPLLKPLHLSVRPHMARARQPSPSNLHGCNVIAPNLGRHHLVAPPSADSCLAAGPSRPLYGRGATFSSFHYAKAPVMFRIPCLSLLVMVTALMVIMDAVTLVSAEGQWGSIAILSTADDAFAGEWGVLRLL